MEQLEIGIVTLNYDESGNVIDANFNPTMQVSLDANLQSQLKAVTSNDNEAENIRQNADLILSGWFSKMNEIELADREKFTIASEVVGECEKYPSGMIKKCTIKYLFKEIA